MEVEKNKIQEISRYKKNKVKYQAKQICEICGGSYDITNRGHHFKTKKHMFIINKYMNE